MLDFPWPPIALLDQFKDQREMRDLIAQEAMADWAFWMMVLTAATTLISLVSIYFLYQTFRQTRKSLAQAELTTHHAQETAFTENRPWIMVFGPTLELTIGSRTENEIRLDLSGTFRIKNDGKMPAVEIEYDILLTQDQALIDTEWKSPPVDGRGGRIILPPGYDNDFKVSGYNIVIRRGQSEPDCRLIQFLVRVSYRSVNAPMRVLKTTGHGILGQVVQFNAAEFSPIVFEKVIAEGQVDTGVFAYSIKFMI